MDSILDALQEGRLFELPESDKSHALQFLAHIIEAFPEIPAGTDVVGLIKTREQGSNTALGKGWACPHARVQFEGDLICVVGWTPVGIDYGAPDGKHVSLLIMHLVPSNQLNRFLREISQLAKALRTYPDIGKLGQARDLNEVRHYLLDLISATKETAGPEARARMIRLQATPILDTLALTDLSNLVVEAVTLITGPGIKPIALTQNAALAQWLESVSDLAEKLENEGFYQDNGWRILRRGTTAFPGGRLAYDCLAIRLTRRSMPGAK